MIFKSVLNWELALEKISRKCLVSFKIFDWCLWLWLAVGRSRIHSSF